MAKCHKRRAEGLRKERVISVLLIIASLSGFVGLMYPTIPVTRTVEYSTTFSAQTEFATSLRTATGTLEYNAQYEVLNGLTISTPEAGIMTAVCGVTYQPGYDQYGNPTINSVPITDCTDTVIATFTSVDTVPIPAQTGLGVVRETGGVGYVGAGENGTIALIIVVLGFFAGMALFIKSRKSAFKRR